uniref:Uncharacterized protein n=1 Tax=Lutzomyia longipalpis TaxID=7200 RepID=A0A1B0FV41_LUTLO
MNDEQSRRTAVNSRSGYKSKATRVKRVAEKYTKDESLLALTSALPEIEHNLSLLPDLRTNLERVQDVIVMMLDSDEEIYRESEDFKITMDNLDAAENELLALRVKARELPQSEDPAKGIIQVLASKLDEMQIRAEVERRVAEEKHKADREADQKKFEATLQQVVNNSFRASSPISHNPPSHVKLKELTVPDFDGKYSEWMSFKDLFTAVIHRNESLSNAHKMYYLLSLLKGEAKSIVEHLPMTSANYSVAWDLLMERYDDPMGMATSYMRDFMSTPKLSDASPDAIRKAHITAMSTVQAIDALGMDQRDIWLIFLTLEKLDPETKVLWSRASYKKTPTWKEFSNFLTERYKTLEIANAGITTKIHNTHKKAEMTPKPHIKAPNWSANVAQGSSSTSPIPATPPTLCVCCGRDNHRTVYCFKFRGMTNSKRLEFVRQANLCSNCLDPGHIADQCTSSACRKCSEKHSTWLHEAFHPVSQGNTATTSSNIASVESNAIPEQPTITGVHPAAKIDARSIPIPPKLNLADPQWHQSQAIDMLLGAQLFWDLVLDRTIRLGPGLPILKQSIFGWLVAGEIASHSSQNVPQSCNLSTFKGIENTVTGIDGMEEMCQGNRVELCATDMEAESCTSTRDPAENDIPFCGIDSCISQWQNKSLTNRKVFVGHRLTLIPQLTAAGNWGYAPSVLNPVKVVSRGTFAKKLLDFGLYWTHPEPLRVTPACWLKDICVKSLQPCFLTLAIRWSEWKKPREYFSLNFIPPLYTEEPAFESPRFGGNCKRSTVPMQSGLLPDDVSQTELTPVKGELQGVRGDDVQGISGNVESSLKTLRRNLGVVLDKIEVKSHERIEDYDKHSVNLPVGSAHVDVDEYNFGTKP